MFLEGLLDESGLYFFPNIALEPLIISLSHKSYSLSPIFNTTLAKILHITCQSSNMQSIFQLCIKNKNFTDFCDSCCLGKSHKLFALLSNTKYKKLFELVYTDLYGPSPSPSSNGNSYYIAFVDAYSKYTWIYFLKHKSDAISSFILFKKYVKTQLYGKMKSIQSYFGGEFIHFTQFLNELGIVHKLTCPHTSHQNGSLEEKIHTNYGYGPHPVSSCNHATYILGL